MGVYTHVAIEVDSDPGFPWDMEARASLGKKPRLSSFFSDREQPEISNPSEELVDLCELQGVGIATVKYASIAEFRSMAIDDDQFQKWLDFADTIAKTTRNSVRVLLWND